MAQEENYIAVVSERLSRPGDTRYVIIDKQTQQEVDNCNGHGYKSAASAHKSFSFKQRRRGGQHDYGRTGYSQGYATRGAATQPPAVHTYRSTPDGQGRSTNRGQAAYGQTARQILMSARPASGQQPRELVSPFVQEASADHQRPMSVRDDGASAVTRANSWSGYAPRRASSPRQSQAQSFARFQRRPQDVSQENTLPPTPDLFDFTNK